MHLCNKLDCLEVGNLLERVTNAQAYGYKITEKILKVETFGFRLLHDHIEFKLNDLVITDVHVW